MWNLKALAVSAMLTIMSLAGIAFYAYNKGEQSGMLQTQTRWDAERLAIQTAQMEEMAKARAKEQALQAQVDRLRRTHRDEVDRINREHDATLAGLRERPEAPKGGSTASVPPSAGTGVELAQWCTGAQLYRDHATAFAGQAALADKLRSALRTCLADRAEIERELNKR